MIYGNIKTNILEIDAEHTNISHYIKKMIGEGINEQLYEKLLHSIIAHMSHEEEICININSNMTIEHKEEHKLLKRMFMNILNNKTFNKNNLALIDRSLNDHYMNFDSTINK